MLSTCTHTFLNTYRLSSLNTVTSMYVFWADYLVLDNQLLLYYSLEKTIFSILSINKGLLQRTTLKIEMQVCLCVSFTKYGVDALCIALGNYFFSMQQYWKEHYMCMYVHAHICNMNETGRNNYHQLKVYYVPDLEALRYVLCCVSSF